MSMAARIMHGTTTLAQQNNWVISALSALEIVSRGKRRTETENGPPRAKKTTFGLDALARHLAEMVQRLGFRGQKKTNRERLVF